MWKKSAQSGRQCFPHSPQGLPHVDLGWVHRLESALQLFVCHHPLSSTPCRLCEWARQTSWLRDLFGTAGEKVSAYSLWGGSKPSVLLFFISWELFTIHNDRHKWFCAPCHNRAHHPGDTGGTTSLHHVIIFQRRHWAPECSAADWFVLL